MKNLCHTACTALSCPFAVLGGMTLIAAFSLAAAYIAQYGFGLEPCILCLYQRIPYAVVVVLGLIGLAVRKNKRAAALVILLCAAAFISNAGIAFYHTGIEQKWWVMGDNGCAVPDFGKDPDSFLKSILTAPAQRCDEIAWQDPVLGLSMANYNVVLSLILALIGLVSFVRVWIAADAQSAADATKTPKP